MSWTFCVELPNDSKRIHLKLVDNRRWIGGHYCIKPECRRIKLPSNVVKNIQDGRFERYAGMTTEEFLVRTFGRDNSR